MTHCVYDYSGVESIYCIAVLVIILWYIAILNDELELPCTLNLPDMLP